MLPGRCLKNPKSHLRVLGIIQFVQEPAQPAADGPQAFVSVVYEMLKADAAANLLGFVRPQD
jgi:hypothetical protein